MELVRTRFHGSMIFHTNTRLDCNSFTRNGNDRISNVRRADEGFTSSGRLNYLHCKIRAIEKSVREPRESSSSELIILKRDSTVDIPGMTVAMPAQNCLDLEKRTRTGR
jgi:hypothetical protein